MRVHTLTAYSHGARMVASHARTVSILPNTVSVTRPEITTSAHSTLSLNGLYPPDALISESPPQKMKRVMPASRRHHPYFTLHTMNTSGYYSVGASTFLSAWSSCVVEGGGDGVRRLALPSARGTRP